MVYTPQTWVNRSPATPASAERLAHMEAGIAGAHAMLSPEFRASAAGVLSAYDYGVRAGTGSDQSTSLHSAFAAAEAAGGGMVIQLPPGEITIAGTFPLAGYSSGLRGSATTAKAGLIQAGTILRAASQTGPVLDFTGFVYPRGQRGRVVFSDFAIRGDGTTGSAKKGILLDTGEGGSSSVDLRNITIYDTGGIGLHVKDHYLSEFHGVTVCNPVNCAVTDTPYVLLEGANGNRYYGLGFRSLNFNDTVADVPPSGALRLIAGAVFQHHLSVFYGPWFENLHLGSNSAMVVTQSNKVTFSDVQFFDCYRVVGATGTTHIRVEPPSTQDYGGNIFRGLIPGKGGGAANEIEAGIDLRQSSNHIAGVKGHGGNNVLLAAGVGYTWAMLGGAEVAGNNAAFADVSGVNTNTLIDGPQGTWILGERSGAGFLRIAGAYQGDKVLARGNVSATTTFTTLFGQNVFTATLTGNITITAITANSSQVGRRITILLKQDSTGSRLVTAWPANVKWAGGSAPTLSTGANLTDAFTFVYDGTNWIETSRSLGA